MVKLGQHFLHDPNIVRKILSLASIQPAETVVEIGPGRGILTRALARAARQVIAMELDRELYRALETSLADLSNVKLICADALEYPWESLTDPFKVVANLPYYIATALLFRLLEVRRKISEMVLMVQREVAERMVAGAGGKAYSPLSVAVQFYTQPRLAFIVPRGCFKPQPEVDSAVVHLVIRTTPPVKVLDEAFFLRVVKAGFSHRRKTLKNSLKDFGFQRKMIEQASSITSLDLSRRAETLTLEEFARLSDVLFELGTQI